MKSSMFNGQLKKDYKESLEKNERLIERMKKLGDKMDGLLDTVECETCGCLLKKETAIKGDSFIKAIEEEHFYNIAGYVERTEEKEVVSNNYYCKKHAPKKKK